METEKKNAEIEKQELCEEELEDASGGIIYFLMDEPKPEKKAGIH